MAPPADPTHPANEPPRALEGATAEAQAQPDDLGPGCVECRVGSSRRVIDVEALGEVVLGRSSEATLVIDDERVSRRHLKLEVRDSVLVATDLGSRNGTLLNGRRLEGERRLRAGDRLDVGPAQLLAGGAAYASRLLGEGDLIDRLDEEIERARAFQRPLGLVGITVLGPTHAIDGATERVLGRIGPGATAGEYAAGRVLVILPERNLEAAAALGRAWTALVEEVAGVRATVTAAGLPESGTEADELVAVAFRAPRAQSVTPAPAAALIAEDPRTREVFETARRVGRSLAIVLITGESGAGKEWVAAEIHKSGPRGAGPYVRINCAALPETLIESELFGHERGAFTGADRRRVGRIESAHGGSLFLDEIGELPLSMQAKLLHVLEDRRVVRVGGNEAVPADVRFIAATNRDLEREVKAGRFREDLYYRLNAIGIEVPPLRERPRDLIALAEHFIVEAARGAGRRPPRMGPRFRAGLESYPWPGNVRELKNVIERAVVLGDADELTARELPDRLRATDAAPPADGPMRRRIEDVERQSLEAALSECGDNRTHAARKLGISRRALIYKLHKFDLIAKE